MPNTRAVRSYRPASGTRSHLWARRAHFGHQVQLMGSAAHESAPWLPRPSLGAKIPAQVSVPWAWSSRLWALGVRHPFIGTGCPLWAPSATYGPHRPCMGATAPIKCAWARDFWCRSMGATAEQDVMGAKRLAPALVAMVQVLGTVVRVCGRDHAGSHKWALPCPFFHFRSGARVLTQRQFRARLEGGALPDGTTPVGCVWRL
jgi:hypothetical protein